MPDSQPTPQFFAYEEKPAPKTPWYRQPKNLRLAGIIGGGVLVLIFAGVLLWNIVASRTSGPRSALEAAQNEVAQRQADCEEGDQACKTQAQTEVARASGEAKACEGLDEKNKTNCVSLIAREKKDAKVCDELGGEDKTSCKDGVLLLVAQDGGTMAACDAITSMSLKASCQAEVKYRARAEGKCAELGVNENECDIAAKLEAIYAATDMDACLELAADDRDECLEYFTTFDIDEDGLRADEESTAGTSDRNADTDGDGYTDKEEIDSGHDPLH